MDQILLSYLLVQLSLLLNANISSPCKAIGCSTQCNKTREKQYPECSEDPHVALDGVAKQLRYSSVANHRAEKFV